MSHTHNIDYKKAFTVEELPDSQVKISGELPFAELKSERTAALVALGKNVEIDGFRKGNVPEKILEKHVGEMVILSEMAERAITHAYPHILEAHSLDTIGQPKIELTKIAPDNPLGFSVTVAVMPEITLPDYKSIAKKQNTEKPSTEVTEEEVDKQIEDILRQKAAYERMQKKAEASNESASPAPSPDNGAAESGDSNDSNTAEGAVAAAKQEEEDLPTPESEAAKQNEEELKIPELTDEVAKSLGQPGQFENVADLKAKLKEHLSIEKERESIAKQRAAITDAILEETKFDMPSILVDSELKQMEAQMQEDLDRADLKLDDYLSHIGKTKEELLSEWRPAAEKRAKLQIVLNEIAKKEELVPNKEKMDTETKALMERFKDADEGRVRLYVASVLMNEEVMKLLEAY